MSQRRILPVLCVVVGMMGAACRAGSAAPTASNTSAPPAASMTSRAEAASTDSAPADVQHPPVTPTVSLTEAQPIVDATSLPTAFDGPLPPGAVARFGTGIIPVYAEARNQELASPDGRYIAIPSGAGMHIYRSDTGEVEWIDRLEQLVYSMEWSPDGSMLAAGSRFGGIFIWDVQSGQRLHTLYAHHGTTVDTLDWSPDGNILASGGSDARIILWNPHVGAPLHMLEGHWDGSTDILVFSPDNSKILAGYHASTDAPQPTHLPTVWDVQSGEVLFTLELPRGSYWFVTLPHEQWSPDGKLLVADEIIYDAATGTMVNTLDSLKGVSWSPTDPLLAVVGEQQVGVWDTQSSELVWSQEEQDYITDLLWSDDGMLLFGANGSAAKLWNASSGQLLHTLRYKTSSNRLAWSPDGSLLFIHTYKDGNHVSMLDTSSGETLSAAPGYLADISWSSNGPVLVTTTATWATDSVTFTNLRTGEVVNRLDGTKYVLGLAWSPDGDSLAVSSTDDYSHRITLWDIQKLSVVWHLGLSDRSDLLSWSPDGKFLTAGWSAATTIIEKTGSPFTTKPQFPFVFSPQGSLLVVGNMVRDAVSDAGISTLKPWANSLRDIAWSPDGTMLVTAGSSGEAWSPANELVVWDARTGNPIHTLKGHSSSINSVAWSPDGTRVVSGATDVAGSDEEGHWTWNNEVIVWDVSSGKASLTKEYDETFQLTDVAWSPDGRLLAVAYGVAPEYLFTNGYYHRLEPSKTTLLDAQTGNQIEELEGHSTSVQTIAFSPDGSLLASGSLDGTVILWDVSQ